MNSFENSINLFLTIFVHHSKEFLQYKSYGTEKNRCKLCIGMSELANFKKCEDTILKTFNKLVLSPSSMTEILKNLSKQTIRHFENYHFEKLDKLMKKTIKL